MMKVLLPLFWMILTFEETYSESLKKAIINAPQVFSITELPNTIFKNDLNWRGADGAATIELSENRILWLFSDTFIDTHSSGHRNQSLMIRNSIGIQHRKSLLQGTITYYHQGSTQTPQDFFTSTNENWFWIGHGVRTNNTLLIFLMEVTQSNNDLGFEIINWHIAHINNPDQSPDQWDINIIKGLDTQGIIIGSSAVLVDDSYLYAYGVKEPSTHEVYLSRMALDDFNDLKLDNITFWDGTQWALLENPLTAEVLFHGQTEFSVHHDKNIEKYIQVQTFGFGEAHIGLRFSNTPQGPWSQAMKVFHIKLPSSKQFAYSANAHPDLSNDGLIITYNINSFDHQDLLNNESIYFPKILQLKIPQDLKGN